MSVLLVSNFKFCTVITMGTSHHNLIWSKLLYWHKVNASELHFARYFQIYPTRPYLKWPNTRAKYTKYAKYGQMHQILYLAYVFWASQLWLSGVSMKRSCKMQLRSIDLMSKKSENSVRFRFQACAVKKFNIFPWPQFFPWVLHMWRDSRRKFGRKPQC